MSKLYKHINIDILPTKNGIGANYNKQIIDWDKSIGYILNFEYGEINGKLKIVYYKRLKLIVEYLNEEYEIGTESLKTCNLGKILNVRTHEYKINIGETITDNNRNLTILDREYRVRFGSNGYKIHEKWYYFKCNKCGHSDWKIESSLISQKTGCPACCVPPKVLVCGINDIPTTAPWMVKYFQGGYDEAKLYHKYSKESIEPICPDCGKTLNTTKIMNICVAKGVNCVCRDGWSYPNKFMYNLLSQLNITFEPEKSFDWSKGRLYDDYIVEFNIIVENHGIFHYDEHSSNKIKRKRNFNEEQENDIYKKELAFKNGIDKDKYIIIDARYSDLEWIKNSIINSNLPKLLKFHENDICWEQCDQFASSNLLKTICLDKGENPNMSALMLSKKYKMARGTIIKYLNKGHKYGWCYYNPRDEFLRERYKPSRNNGETPIICIETNEVFRSSTICEKHIINIHNIKVISRNIRSVCNGKRNMCGGLHFRHISKQEFNTIKSQSPELAFGDYFISAEESTDNNIKP